MSQNRRYLIIAIIIMAIITLWVSRGQDTEVAPTALPANGMVEENAANHAVTPPEPAPAMEDMGMPAPAMDDAMPAMDASEVDGVPQGAEVYGDAPAETTDMPAAEDAAQE